MARVSRHLALSLRTETRWTLSCRRLTAAVRSIQSALRSLTLCNTPLYGYDSVYEGAGNEGVLQDSPQVS
jgi:hypothetical protein